MKGGDLRSIHIQSGCTDGMNRPLDGLFQILLDEDVVARIMERAYGNKTKQARMGGVVVRYKAMTKAQAEYIVKNPGAASF